MTGGKHRESESDGCCHWGDSDDWWRCWRQRSRAHLTACQAQPKASPQCTGLQMQCKFCKISQKVCTTLCKGVLYCIANLAKMCGASGRGWCVLVKRNYTEELCKALVCIVFPTLYVPLHSLLAPGLPRRWIHDCNHCAPNYLTSPPPIQASVLQCKTMQMQLIESQCTAKVYCINWFWM